MPITADGVSSKKKIVCALHTAHIRQSNKQRVVVTFFDPLVLYFSTGDLIGLSLLIFLQFLGILHLLSFRFIQITLLVYEICSNTTTPCAKHH